jgi:hypothetical protein
MQVSNGFDLNPKLGALSWKAFLSYYEQSLKGKVKETPDELFKLLGGKMPPKKNKEEGGE